MQAPQPNSSMLNNLFPKISIVVQASSLVGEVSLQ